MVDTRMTLVSYVEKVTETLLDSTVGIEDVNAVFVDFLHKRASKADVENVRQKLLTVGKRLYRDTRTLNALLDDPDALVKLNAMKVVPKTWASRLLSLPLLRSSLVQLQNATSITDTLLGISRLISIVEDSEEKLKVPFSPRISGKNPHFNNIYYYLMNVANWSPDERNGFISNLHFFSDKLLQRITKEFSTKLNKIGSKPRPLGW